MSTYIIRGTMSLPRLNLGLLRIFPLRKEYAVNLEVHRGGQVVIGTRPSTRFEVSVDTYNKRKPARRSESSITVRLVS